MKTFFFMSIFLTALMIMLSCSEVSTNNGRIFSKVDDALDEDSINAADSSGLSDDDLLSDDDAFHNDYSNFRDEDFSDDEDEMLFEYSDTDPVDSVNLTRLTRQWGAEGSESHDVVNSMAVDKDGFIYITGSTTGAMHGNIHYGYSDAFLIKSSPEGVLIWTRQWGSEYSDSGSVIAIDSKNNVYVAGNASGVFEDSCELEGICRIFIIKYDENGDRIWIKQFGEDYNDSIEDLIIDKDGSLLVTGSIKNDIFLSRFNKDGDEIWQVKWGTDDIDSGGAVAVSENGEIWLSGWTYGDLDGNINTGGSCNCIFTGPLMLCYSCAEFFLSKLDSSGGRIWTKMWGNVSSDEKVSNILFDQDGNILISGKTQQAFEGFKNAGGSCGTYISGYNYYTQPCYDRFLFKTDVNGNSISVDQWGWSGNDFCGGLSLSSTGDIIAGGRGIISFNNNFTELWNNDLELINSGDLVTLSDDRIVVSGGLKTKFETADIFLGTLNSDGETLWERTISGSSSSDYAYAVAMSDDGTVIVAGSTNGSMGNSNYSGGTDAFISKWSGDGKNIWNRQTGTPESDVAIDVAVDKEGSIFVTGYTEGSFNSGINSGKKDVFLAKWNSSGSHIWTRQWGSSENEKGNGVAVDNDGNIFVTGTTSGVLNSEGVAGMTDIFITGFMNDGSPDWTVQWGSTSDDESYDIAVDKNGDIVITGETFGGLDGESNGGEGCTMQVYGGPGSGSTIPRYTSINCSDGFIAKFSKNGKKIWSRQWGNKNSDTGRDIAFDEEGNIFLTGSANDSTTDGIFSGKRNALFAKWTSEGEKEWSNEYVAEKYTDGKGITINKNGDIFVTGTSEIDKDYNPFLMKIDKTGNPLWMHVWGSEKDDEATSIVSGGDIVFVTGYTSEIIDNNRNYGREDAFLSIFKLKKFQPLK
jgi:uncharacterized delta-60 repeat protein